MQLRIETTLKIVAIILVASHSEASVANLLADRALAKLSDWIKTDGSIWLTLPGHFQQGQIHNVDNKFTLAFAGPRLTSIGELTRSGDAILDDAEPDPLYKSSQKLRFTAKLLNVTAIYRNVAYTEDDLGSYNFTPIASTDSINVETVLDIKGDLETCVGFLDIVNVNSNGATAITVGDKHTEELVPAVLGAVSTHFKNNVVTSLQTLLESGTFSSLENYDICNDAYNPLLPANMFAEQIVGNVIEGLNSNVTNWAWLPGFWKQFHAPNGTVTNFLRVDVGNFSSAGNVRRVGDASYSNSGDSQAIGADDILPPANDMADKILAAMTELVEKHHSDWTHLPESWKQYFDPNNETLIYYIVAGFGNFTRPGSMKRIDAEYTGDNSNLNIVFETDSMSAIYGDVTYTSNWFRYKMVETIRTKKLKTSLSVSFSAQGDSGIPTCYGGSVSTSVFYKGRDLEVENLTPGVPDDVQSLVKSQLSDAFLKDVIGAVEELYSTVAMNVLQQVCSHNT